MFGFRLPELLIILALVLVVFGANKIPQLGAGLGQGLRSFKKAFGGEPESEPEAKPRLPPPDKGPPPPSA